MRKKFSGAIGHTLYVTKALQNLNWIHQLFTNNNSQKFENSAIILHFLTKQKLVFIAERQMDYSV